MLRVEASTIRFCGVITLLGLLMTGCGPEGYRDVRSEHWDWWGADIDVVEGVIDKVRSAYGDGEFWDSGSQQGPGEWTWEFSRVAEQVLERAQQLESGGDLMAASHAYDEASVYFGLAKYPHIARTEAQNKALQRQLVNYRRSFELAGYGYEIVTAELKGKTVSGLLHLPSELENVSYPLVIGTNGLDVFAAESGPLVRDLLDRGIAVLTSDIPGTGLNSNIPLEPDFEQLWLVFLSSLADDSRIDFGKVGAFGMSFGGNAAVKLAMTHQDTFRAIANICGPVHDVFAMTTAQVAQIDPMYLDGLIDRMHLPDSEPETIIAAASQFSLIGQGLIGNGQQTRVPVLSLNAKNDYVAPESDLHLINDASAEGTIIWSGSNNHCPQYREKDMPLVADFFAKYLL